MALESMPKYVQIKESFAEKIATGQLKPGDKIPSERELAHQFGVSRMTVREALTLLTSDGQLERIQGSGTYVAQPKLEHRLNLLASHTESAMQGAIEPTAKLLESKRINASQKIARALDLPIGQSVYRVMRLRFGNTTPMVLERAYFPCDRFQDLLDFDVEHASLFRILRDEHGVRFGRMIQVLEPIPANEFEARVLEVSQGSPLMLVCRQIFDADGRPVEHDRDVYRGDRSRFVSEVDISDWANEVGLALAEHD